MSKIGEKPITIPPATEIEIKKDLIEVKGKEGVLSLSIPSSVAIIKENNLLKLERSADDKQTKSLHGTIRNLINNALLGVNQLWQKRVEVFGTGYKVKLDKDDLVFNLGQSHPILFKKVEGVTLAVEGANKVIVKGVNRQLVGEVAEKIRRLKKPDPYKGKGIRYEGEKLKLKPGKKAKTLTTAVK